MSSTCGSSQASTSQKRPKALSPETIVVSNSFELKTHKCGQILSYAMLAAVIFFF